MAAMTPLTRTVKSSGRWLRLLSAHRAFHSSLRFFFITMARRKGESSNTVSTPVRALAYQPSGRMRVMNGWNSTNISVMMAVERMP